MDKIVSLQARTDAPVSAESRRALPPRPGASLLSGSGRGAPATHPTEQPASPGRSVLGAAPPLSGSGRAASMEAAAPQPAGAGRTTHGEHGDQALPDWASAIELLRDATEALRVSEGRAAELAEELNYFSHEAAEKLRLLNAEVIARDEKIALAEERLRAAEARADEAEAWLRKLHDAIHLSFSSLRR